MTQAVLITLFLLYVQHILNLFLASGQGNQIISSSRHVNPTDKYKWKLHFLIIV